MIFYDCDDHVRGMILTELILIKGDTMKNEQIVFNKVPDGMPQDDTFKYEETDVTEPENNEVQETLYISVDPI